MRLEDLNGEQRDQFEDLRLALEQLGVWNRGDAGALAELVELRRLQAEAIARYRENPGPGRGSRGQAVENAELKTYLAISARALELTRDLLLTPRSRRRAGVPESEEDPLLDLLGDDSSDP